MENLELNEKPHFTTGLGLLYFNNLPRVSLTTAQLALAGEYIMLTLIVTH